MPTLVEQLAEAVEAYVETTRQTCWECGGSGWEPRPDPLAPLVCAQCRGTGEATLPPFSGGIAAGVLQDVVVIAHGALNAGNFDDLNAVLDWGLEYAQALAAASIAELQNDPEQIAHLERLSSRIPGTSGAPTGQLAPEELERLLHDDDQGDADPPR